MSPITHFLVSWAIAGTSGLRRRERAAVALAGVAPDLDGMGVVPELLARGSTHPLPWFSEYHHILGHNLGFAIIVTIAGFLFARAQRWKTAVLVFVSFHLHLMGDVIGARGPDGYAWPIPYLLPFSHRLDIVWQGQWALNAWQNFVITGFGLAIMFLIARNQGHSPLEIVSKRADSAFVSAVRNRFPVRASGTATT
jgi:LexA-binding, inner membrane-associated putative hydrolase